MEVLLERETAMAELGRLWHQAVRDGGRVVLLHGEAGVGKTAVIRRFIAGLNEPVRVLRGSCDPLSTPRALGPLVDMLAQLRGPEATELAAAVDRGSAEAIYARLRRLFADGNSWVSAFEDVHWADGATLDLLRLLTRRVASLPVLVLASYRDDEVGPQHPLAVALGDLANCAAVTRIGLEPLSLDAVAVLAAGHDVNAAELHRLTGGNPFFVTQILAAGPDALNPSALPRSVREAVWGRLARLSPGARDTAHAAAICGPRGAGPQLLENVSPGATAALDECLHAGVLRADGTTVAFRHELARLAALNQIPDYRRRMLHTRALAALAEPPIHPDTLSALAFHAEQVGDSASAARYGPAAAQRAASLGAHREAADQYAVALRHADSIPPRQKAVWLEEHAFASYVGGFPEPAIGSWRAAIALRHELGDRIAEGDDLRWLSHMLWVWGRTSEATDAGRTSLRLLENFDPCPQLAWSLVNLAQLAACSYDPAAAGYAARAITLGTQLDEPAVVVRVRIYAALANVLRTDTGWDALEAAWRAAMDAEALAESAGITGAMLCWTAALHHDLDRAERYIIETSAFCRDHDLGTFHAFAVGTSALVSLYRGDWDRADAAAHDVLTRPGLSPLHRTMPLLSAALIRARRGDQTPGPGLDEARASTEPDNVLRLGAVWAACAEAAWLRGDDDTARAEAQTGLEAVNALVGADPWVIGHLHRWAKLSGGQPGATLAADSITPYRLEVSGDWRAAANEWTRRGCPYDAALAQLGGDIPAVEAALATFRRLGARAAARRAHERLSQARRRAPYRRRTDAHAHPHGLTERERDVLELLAAGHSDADIATALCISPKTASNHVAAILAKLGVHNRTQAAASCAK